MNLKIRDTLFFIIIISLVFNNIPSPLQMNFLGGPIGNQLIFYPVVIGFIYTAYCQYKKQDVLVDFNKFKRFVFFYVGVIFISLIVGLYKYPYYDLITNGPINQIEKLPIVLNFLQGYGIIVDSNFAVGIWMIARVIKGVFLEVLYTFGLSYMIYCWYKDNFEKAMFILNKGLILSLIILIGYSGIEIFYLAGNEFAKNILSIINPYIHAIKTQVNWWPPLLWKGQMRSIFSEPSHIGNSSALIIPFLWCEILRKDKCNIFLVLGTFLFSCMIFLTKARTANAMFFGMFFILSIFLLMNFKEWIKKYILICGISLLSFMASLYFINNFMVANKMVEKQVTASTKSQTSVFISDNVASLASDTKRSNGARYALLRSNMRVAIDNPVLGVGKGLASAYIMDNFTESERRNPEINMWLNHIEKKGILKYSLGAMNEYVGRFAQTGLIGLGMFLLPFIFVIYCLFKLYVKQKCFDSFFLLFALISSLVVAMNGSITLMYNVWILLPLTYIAINKDVDEKLNNE